MTNNTQYIVASKFGKDVQKINENIDTLNKKMGDYAQQVVKNPSLAEEKPKEPTPPKEASKKDEPYTPIDFSGDFRMNPVFLNVADYLGLDSRDYNYAGSKIAKIADWASRATKSKEPSKIIAKIGEVSRGLQSPGYGEKRYAILYRYVRLASDEDRIKSELKTNPDNPILAEEQNKLKEEMQAYKNNQGGS